MCFAKTSSTLPTTPSYNVKCTLQALIQGNQGDGWLAFQDECLQSITIAAEFKVHVEVLTECYHGE